MHTASDSYARRFAGPVGAYLLDRQAAGVRRLLGRAAPRGREVLCVGGGHDQLTATLLGAGHRVTVHGSAATAFRPFEPAGGGRTRRVSRCVSSLWNLPFADGAFDVVVGIRLLAHVERWRELLAEMSRVTRDLVLIDYPRVGGAQRVANRLFGLKRRLESSTRPFFAYDDTQVLAVLQASGLAPVDADGQFVLPMALHRLGQAPAFSRAAEDLLSRLGLGARYGSPLLMLARRTSVPGDSPFTRQERHP